MSKEIIDLHLLKQPKCKTCGDSKRVRKNEPYCLVPRGLDNYWFKFCDGEEPPAECLECPEHKHNKKLIEYKPCPDCQQPPTGEWTKEMREKYKHGIVEKLCVPATVFDEALVRLDASEAKVTDLLAACEGLMDLINKGELVRNIENDNSANWAINQIPLVKTLQEAIAAIEKAKE